MNKHGIHITHNDADAVGCALVLSYFENKLSNDHYDFEDNTYFCSIGHQDDKVKELMEKINNGEEEIPSWIVISDISLSEETCDLLEEFAIKHDIILNGFDHHKTNNLDQYCEWWTIVKDEVESDEGPRLISATKVMYNYFIQKGKIVYSSLLEDIVNIISDYDTWMWRRYPKIYSDIYLDKLEPKKYEYEADIVKIICSFLKPQRMFHELLEHVRTQFSDEMSFPHLFHTIYDIDTENRNFYLKSFLYKVKVYEIHNYSIAMFISENNYDNAAAECLYNAGIDLVVIIYPSSKRISFRTKRDDIDVGLMAKKSFGGGGHAKAAGANIEDNDEFLEFLSCYYKEGIILKESKFSEVFFN